MCWPVGKCNTQYYRKFLVQAARHFNTSTQPRTLIAVHHKETEFLWHVKSNMIYFDVLGGQVSARLVEIRARLNDWVK